MADVKLNTLPQSTSPTSTQDLLLFDESTNAGQRINYNTLADVILAKLTSKTYTVGGGTQTLISAIDALNSNFIYASSLDDLCTKILAIPTSRTAPLFTAATATSALINVNFIGKGYVSKVSNILADILLYSGGYGELYTVRINPTTKEITDGSLTSLPTRNEVNALKNVLSPSLSGCGSNSAIHAVQIGTVVAVTAKIEYSGTSNMAISGLPNHNGDTQNGFVVTARDQTDGSIVRMWTNGGKNIMKYDNLTEGHMYGLSYTYITA